ncbi:MAG TPA: cobalamin-dependent protein [Thermoguttaceae bacterium]|nr:cobalamin-dependent protein [Thermoguttaceae bacterium]
MIKKADDAHIHPVRQEPPSIHPAGSRTRILLSSVFGPYAQDDEYGSRAINPMELYHNQVTRTQGAFSLRMFHRSWGLMLIQANVEAPCTVLDFPDLDRFVEELRTHKYDVVGITGIVSNVLKVKKMCELVREYQPEATIVVGGHVANVPDLHERIAADHIVRGEGVRWFRRFLGEDEDRPIRHPLIVSGLGTRNVGVQVKDGEGDTAATLIPSVGCPLGCNFCSTSAMFGGKGNCIHFYQTGDELFDVMCQIERDMNLQSFFVMDENFLLHRRRALRLLELMEKHQKVWAICVFSSARVLRSYTMDQLVRLGVSWVWMGLEGENSQYTKLDGVDTFELVRELQSHGVRVLGSTIIALENHTPENIDEVIEYAARHDTDFHQFMLYTPIPGTPLHRELSDQGRMKDPGEFEAGDIHGQSILNYRHLHINDEQSAEFMIRAFDRDFERNGPSIVRITRTTLAGWKHYKDHPDPRVRRRFVWEARELATTYSALVAGAKLYYRKNPAMYAKTSALLRELHREFGWKSRLYSAVGGRYVLRKIRREEKRLAEGWTREPPTIYERNAAVLDNPQAQLCRYVTPAVTPVPASKLSIVPVEETVGV